jgi:hypothetical protein
MHKATVTKLFIGSVIAIGAGAILAIIALGLAFANDVFVISGSEIVDVRGTLLPFSLFILGAVGGIAIAGGMIGGLISWIGALLNTAQLESKTWFVVLLVLGIFNLGFFAMIAYVLAGPDGKAVAAPHRATAPA